MPLPDWLKESIRLEQIKVPWWVEAKEAEQAQRMLKHKMELLRLQKEEDLFPNSKKDNPQKRDLKEYLERLAPYQYIIQSDKNDFLNKDAGLGHKVHLNVDPLHVREVSEYLKQNRYAHKYLSGGEVEDNTIFTVYFGSLLKAKLANVLSKDLEFALQRPLMKYEIEYSPNISGRFVGNREEFTQYPAAKTRGISSLIDLVGSDNWTERTPEEAEKHKLDVFEISYKRLSDLYGSFFYGE